MLKWAFIFLIVPLVAGAPGFTGIARTLCGGARQDPVAIFLAIFVILPHPGAPCRRDARPELRRPRRRRLVTGSGGPVSMDARGWKSGMPSPEDWLIPAELQPEQANLAYDLREALACVVGLRAIVPEDAFTAETLGTERIGHGVAIRADGLVLTIGYLITEAQRDLAHDVATGAPCRRMPLAYDYDERLRPRAGSGAPRRAGAEPRHIAAARRSAMRWWSAPPAAGPHSLGARDRRAAGIRGLLGIPPRGRDLHGAGASALGRHGPDRPARRPPRHRLAAAPAPGAPAGASCRSTWSCRSTT